MQVDLDAKNILNASAENAKGWASELTKILNRDEKFVLLTYLQLVSTYNQLPHIINWEPPCNFTSFWKKISWNWLYGKNPIFLMWNRIFSVKSFQNTNFVFSPASNAKINDILKRARDKNFPRTDKPHGKIFYKTPFIQCFWMIPNFPSYNSKEKLQIL